MLISRREKRDLWQEIDILKESVNDALGRLTHRIDKVTAEIEDRTDRDRVADYKRFRRIAGRILEVEKRIETLGAEIDKGFSPFVPPDLVRITADEIERSRYEKRLTEARDRAAAEFFRERHLERAKAGTELDLTPELAPKPAPTLFTQEERKERWVRAWRQIRVRIELEGPVKNQEPKTFTLKGQRGLLRLIRETAPKTSAFFNSCPDDSRQFYPSTILEWAVKHKILTTDRGGEKYCSRLYSRKDVAEIFSRAEAFISEHPEVFGEFTEGAKNADN